MNRRFRPDCDYYLTEGQRLRPYCNKLSKEIRPYNCTGCGWYKSTGKNDDDKVLGVGSMSPEDITRLVEE